MKLDRARTIFGNLNNEHCSDKEKIEAVVKCINCAQQSTISKEAYRNAFRWFIEWGCKKCVNEERMLNLSTNEFDGEKLLKLAEELAKRENSCWIEDEFGEFRCSECGSLAHLDIITGIHNEYAPFCHICGSRTLEIKKYKED